MRVRIASLMKLIVIVAIDCGIIAWMRRNADHHDPLSDFFGMLWVVFLLATTPFLVMASWPCARPPED